MSFCTVINCMDGRVQLPVINYMTDRFDVEYVDSITEPGPVAVLAYREDKTLLSSIQHRLAISTEIHNSRVIAIAAHSECAGNPVDDAKQLEELALAAEFLKENYPKCQIIKLWLGNNWVPQPVNDV